MRKEMRNRAVSFHKNENGSAISLEMGGMIFSVNTLEKASNSILGGQTEVRPEQKIVAGELTTCLVMKH